MAKLSIAVSVDQAGAAAATEAFAALTRALVGRDLLEAFADRPDGIIERDPDHPGKFRPGCIDSFFAPRCVPAAGGASGMVLLFEPAERFRELVAAVAREGDFEIIDIHGWPVLSLVSDCASMAGGGAASSCAPEGDA